MKFKADLSLIIFFISLFFIGCSKDTNDDNKLIYVNPPGNNTGIFSAKVDGVNFIPSLDSATASMTQGSINITAITSNGKTISITVMDTMPGTFDLSPTGTLGVAVYKTSPSGGTIYNSNVGPWNSSHSSITISSIDRTNKFLSGTFKFKALNSSSLDSVSVTDGVFTYLPYTTNFLTGQNSFTVTVDGSVFTPGNINGNVTGTEINIIASESSGLPSVGITVPSNIIAGNYSLQPLGTYRAIYNSASGQYMLVTSGSLTITEHNTITKKLTGTFSFNAAEFNGGTGTASLNNGSFSVSY